MQHRAIGPLLTVRHVEQVAATMAQDGRLPFISATGTGLVGRAWPRPSRTAGSKSVRTRREQRDHRGQTADLSLAVRAIVFAAVGTAGQRCTTTRRLFVHEFVTTKWSSSWLGVSKHSHRQSMRGRRALGSAHRRRGGRAQSAADREVKQAGGKVVYGGQGLDQPGYFVEPTIVQAESSGQSSSAKPFARFFT